MSEISQFAAAVAPYAITGAIVSLLVQWLKPIFDKSGHKLLLAILGSILGGVALQFVGLVPTEWFTTIVSVFASANTVYLLVIQWFEDSTPTIGPVPNTAPLSQPPSQPAA